MMKSSIAFALSTAMLAGCASVPPAQPAQPEIAITVDDLPLHGPTPRDETAVSVARAVISALTAAHVPAYGFINGHWTVDDTATAPVLTMWRAAGLPLGNHGWSHRHFSEMSAAEFEDQLAATSRCSGAAAEDWRWFRYPFLDEGENAGKRAAAARSWRGTATGCSSDNGLQRLAVDRALCALQGCGDQAAIDRLEQLYMQAAPKASVTTASCAQSFTAATYRTCSCCTSAR